MIANATRYTVAGLLIATVGSVHAADLSAVPSGTYNADPTHSYITFSYSHLGLSNPVIAFDDFTVDMNLDSADPTKSMISVTIDPSSVVAGSDIWREHLTGADFFDIANHPDITFQSTNVEVAGDGSYRVSGDMTIKGETKPMTLTVAINAAMNHPMSGDPVVGIGASSEILRSEFGMGKFAPNVSDEVTINVTAELVKAK